MTPKKTNRTNLEKKRLFFFEYGVIVILAVLLAAFEWGKKEPIITDFVPRSNDTGIDEDPVEVTRMEKKLLKPPVLPTQIIAVPDPTIIIDEPTIFFNVDGNPSENIPDWVFKTTEETAIEDTFIVVEEMPKYRGGDVINFKNHVQELVVYPQEAINVSVQGKVFVQFIVNEKGILTNPKIVRSPDDLLSNSVLTALKQTEKWTPGKQRKIPVKVSFTIPISFELRQN